MSNPQALAASGGSSRDAPLGRDFWLYAAGRGVSAVGDRIALIALVFLVIHASRSFAPAIALFYVVRLLPQLAGGLFAGVVVDQVDRRRLMVGCDLARGAIFAIVPTLTSVTVWALYPAVFVLYGLSLLFETSASAALPDIVPEARLTTANAILSGFTTAADAFYALGGILVFVFGSRIPFLIDAGTFLFSALMIGGMRVPRTRRLVDVDPAGVVRRIRDGIDYVRSQPFLRWSVVVLGFAPFAGGLAFVVTPLYANHGLASTPHLFGPLRSGAFRFSLLEVALGMGALLGTGVAARLAGRWPRGRLFGLGLTGMGLCEISLAFTQNLYVAMPVLVLEGLCNCVFIVAAFTLIQTLTASEMRGRVLASNATVVNSALALGSACGGALLLALSYGQMWFLAGVIIEAASLFVWLRPDVRGQI